MKKLILLFLLIPNLVFAGTVIRFNPKESEVKTGEEIIFKIEVDKVENLFSAPLYIFFDPKILDFISLEEGDFLKKDGKRTIFMKSVKNGEIIVGLSRLGDVGGLSGSGDILKAVFKAKKKGKTELSFKNVDFRSSKLALIKIEMENARIKVK